MKLEYIKKTLKNEFDNFIVKVNNICDKPELLGSLLEENNKYEKEINPRLLNFHKLLKEDNLFDLFLKSKIKLFSSKNENTNNLSISLFGVDLTLKFVLNNRSSEIKSSIWKYLHLFYFLIESSIENYSKDRVNKVSLLLSDNKSDSKSNVTDNVDVNISDQVKKDILKVDVNDTTNNLIDDIVQSFQQSLDGSDSGNPFDCIMDITQKITEKYQKKIDSGEVELDKMMGSIGNTIPGMGNLFNKKEEEKKEKVVIDENFSTDNVELGDKDKDDKQKGFNLQGMMGMMNGMNGKNGGPNLKGLMDVMGKLNNIETEEDAEKLKFEMDNYLEKELGVDVSKLNATIENIETNANINNVVNQVGMMDTTLPDIVEVNENLEQLD